jgi:hypothetical protein
MGNIQSMAMSGAMQSELYGSGNGNSAAMANMTDQIQMSLTHACEMVAKTISIDSPTPSVTDANVDKDEKLTKTDIVDMQGEQLAITVLMVLLIMFLKKVPELAQNITSSGALAPLTRVAGGLGNKLQNFSIGSGGDGGVLGSVRGAVKSGMQTRK